VRALHIAFGAQVFEVDPKRPVARRDPLHARRQLAAEGLDQHLAERRLLGLARPGQGLDARVGLHPAQRAGVVDEQLHRLAACHQFARQAQAEARVSMVVDDAAEQTPAHQSANPALRRRASSSPSSMTASA
jgi:hypothetical protein